MDPFKTLTQSLADKLKELGFKKRSKTCWQLTMNENICFLTIESAKQNGNGGTPFTVSLGIVSNYLVNALKDIDFFHKGEPGLPEQAERTRLGLQMPQQKDIWWEVTPENLSETAAEVENAIVNFGMPYFEKKSPDEALCEHWLWVFKTCPDAHNFQTLRFLTCLLKKCGFQS